MSGLEYQPEEQKKISEDDLYTGEEEGEGPVVGSEERTNNEELESTDLDETTTDPVD